VLGAMNPLPFLNEGFITDLDEFTLFAYTDGLTETVNEAGAEYGVQALVDYLQANRNKEIRTMHQDIIVNLDGFKGRNGYRDDITILSCRVG
jgi:sigma-B regulation protein RsbU (phosphoserine phosphatase)